MTIATTIAIVHTKRLEVTKLELTLIAQQQLLEQTPLYGHLQDVKSLLAAFRTDLDAAETALRSETIEQYHFTGAKKYPGVEIKLTTRLTYPEQDARDYCREHLPNALKLDRTSFEKVAKVLPLDFVTITQEPKAYIAGDLSAFCLSNQTTQPEGDPEI